MLTANDVCEPTARPERSRRCTRRLAAGRGSNFSPLNSKGKSFIYLMSKKYKLFAKTIWFCRKNIKKKSTVLLDLLSKNESTCFCYIYFNIYFCFILVTFLCFCCIFIIFLLYFRHIFVFIFLLYFFYIFFTICNFLFSKYLFKILC